MRQCQPMSNQKRLRSQHGNIAELPPALFVFFILVVFPTINLFGLAAGMVSLMLVTQETASRAANQPTYAKALTAMSQQASLLLNSGFAHFANIRPIGGYQGTGNDLYVVATSYSGSVKTFGPDTPLPPPVDSATNVYEYSVHSKYAVGPIISFAGVPLLAGVPAMGQPALLGSL